MHAASGFDACQVLRRRAYTAGVDARTVDVWMHGCEMLTRRDATSPFSWGVALQQLGSWFSHLREPERASKPAKQQPCPYALRTETRERERERIESYRPM